MRNLLIGVACTGVAASIALGVRHQLTETPAPAPAEAVAPAATRAAAQAPGIAPGTTASEESASEPRSNVVSTEPKVGSAKPTAETRGVTQSNGGTNTPAVVSGREDAGADAASEQEDGAAVLRRAAAAYGKIQSMRADFTQVQENPILRRKITSRGTFFQQRPDKFLMRFSEPAGDLVVGDGRYFWIYYPSHDAKQVIRLPASAGQAVDLQAQFIGDPTKRFRHTLNGKEEVAGRRASVLTLVPVEPAGYRSLKVWIDDGDSLIRRFVLTNDNGVVQNFDLSNLQVNPKLDPALFRFTPPAGATVVQR